MVVSFKSAEPHFLAMMAEWHTEQSVVRCTVGTQTLQRSQQGFPGSVEGGAWRFLIKASCSLSSGMSSVPFRLAVFMSSLSMVEN